MQTTEQRGKSPVVIIHLLKGVVYGETHPEIWRDLLANQGFVRDYLGVIGLEVIIDESEGYAFLRQRESEDGDQLDQAPPRLMHRRPLSYPVSLLCVLLRRKLAEHDVAGGDTRLILDLDQMVEMIRVFLPETSDEVRLHDLVEQAVHKITGYGFLRRLKGDEELYEVRRIIKALVDASWLDEMNEKLQSYRHATNII